LANERKYKILTYFFAAVWLISGLFCKVFNLVPRHEEIVARILGQGYSRILTILIGLSEIGISFWILTKFKPRLNAIVQMTIVAIMNILEFNLAPDLLLWGRWNIVFAFMFIGLIFYTEFILNTTIKRHARI
jgi:hypothetical protein